MKNAYTVLGLFLAFALVFGSGQSTAQSFPSKPIRIIVGYPPGGTNDLLPRIVSPQLAERLGQPVVVENKPGADAMIASEYVARASPDGYTLLVGASGQMVYNPALGARLTYDPLKDFVPITMFASDPLVFVVNPSVQATNIKELIALAKAKPGALFYAAGAPPFFVAMETFKKVAGVNIVHVPYKGSGASINAAMAGEVPMVVVSVGPVLTHLRSGKLRALAVTSDNRDPVLPEIPTVRESGLDFEGGMWSALYAPAGTPSAVIDRLYGELSAILKSESMKKQFATLGYDTGAMGMSPAELGTFHRAQLEKWTRVVKEYDIRVAK
ncbi:MAG: hypothetical protein A2V78_02575 [Betaproteobacteria bacterium RBG_16_64_18]|nr:MAG: hypothetical protein A2V78_02575 [Betaproteobacteria bacterium RBG_16_64_18]OGA07615.1 MAG: hypothetical protein A3H33_01700 [Betaproteobacteria bacterium RIFCSPLOWO2_02_FULL_65_20]OGA36887.1 MAG: hypothetical protein A3G26_11640 [Betaproteobacteria bacterium RIFCSPLOWO2_12_FULL_65_110]